MARKALLALSFLTLVAAPAIVFLITDRKKVSSENTVDEAVAIANRQITATDDPEPNAATQAPSSSPTLVVPPNPSLRNNQNENKERETDKISGGHATEISPQLLENETVRRSAGNLRREGTEVVSLKGFVSKKGVEVVFTPHDGSSSMALLQNQVLERLEHYAAIKAREGTQPTWSVTGLITEYEGANFLLLSSAVLIESKP